MIDPITVISLMAEALGLSIDLKEAAKAYAKKVRDTERQSFVAKWRTGQQKLRGMRSDLTRFLHEWYSSTASASDDFLGIRYYSRNDSPNTSRVLPLVTKKGQLLADNPNFRGNAEYCGRLLEQNPNSHVGLTDDELVEQVSLWSALGMKIFDAPLYSLQEVSAEGDMKFRLTRFFVYRPTFGALPDELTLAVADHRIEEIRNNPDEYLPLRSKILPDLQVLTEFAGRIVAGGPAVLFAVTLPKGDVGVLLQRRSRTVSDEQGVFSVVPKAFHQPMVDADSEVSLRNTVLRESYEELFGGEETGGYVDPVHYLQKCDAVRELADPEVATIQPTGLVWDLSRGNYHPLYCCFVQDPHWWERYKSSVRLNWEVDPEVRPLVPLSDSKTLANILGNEEWAPESYVALVEGLRWLAKGTKMSTKFSQSVKSLLPRMNLEPMAAVARS